MTDTWNSPNRQIKAQQNKVTLVPNVPRADLRFLRMAIEMKEYQLPAIQRFLAQVEKQLPKED